MLKDKTKEQLIRVVENMPTVDNTKVVDKLIYDLEIHISCQEQKLSKLKWLIDNLPNCNNKDQVADLFTEYSKKCCQDTFSQEACLVVSSYVANWLNN